jgi:diguanylate cyclase (GGDEF)-like protein
MSHVDDGYAEIAGPTEGRRPGKTSLRSRWTRAFALLTALIVLSGLAGLVGSRLLVDNFRTSALTSEREATLGARLRTDVVAQSIALSSPTIPGGAKGVAATQRRIRADFAEAIRTQDNAAAKALFTRSSHEWNLVLAAVGSADAPSAVAVRGQAVSVHAPKVLSLLDQAGTLSRTANRSDLVKADRTERATLAVLGLLELLTLMLVLRLSRRLSIEVLRPVGLLRDSANHLANGELDHRVVIDRADELGELSTSFNAMADAIAGSQRSLTREANTDSLTGLANRASFRARLESTLEHPDRRGGHQAVLFVDLDDFKDVNDTLGHAAGDDLLQTVSDRLVETVRPGDVVARLGGDEFAILLEGLADPRLSLVVAERVVAALAKPIDIMANSVHVGASVGLAVRHGESTLDSLMREADVAMYAAKAKGKNRVETFDLELDTVAAARLKLHSELEGVADRGELVVDYQPIVELGTGQVVGLEALVRWQHPTRGLLPPSEFIAAAEETGAIVAIGAFVLETATRQMQSWQRRYERPDLWLSVNVSVCQLDLGGFADGVTDTLGRVGFDPTMLVLEVTESVLADPDGAAPSSLAAVRQLGVRVALDDFGTGYSSIGYLSRLPVDILKIDRSFLASGQVAGSGSTLLEAVVGMARGLGLDVVPEGIEELDQLSRLHAMGCRYGQGFLMSRPLSTEAVDVMLATSIPLPHVGLPGQLASAASV